MKRDFSFGLKAIILRYKIKSIEHVKRHIKIYLQKGVFPLY